MTDKIQLIGRYEVEKTGVSFSWPGFKIKGVFNGTGLSVKIKSPRCFFLIEVDNTCSRLEVDPEKLEYTLAEGLPCESHSFSITLCHEPDSKIILEDIATDGHFLTSPQNELKIEFIGDSLTVGYGNKSPGIKWDRTDSYIYYTNSAESFAAVAGRELNADTVLTAYSGKGLTHNYNNDSPGINVPSFYNSVHRFTESPKWDKSKFSPDITVVNLGTNDFSNSIDHDKWRNSYLDFVEVIRKKHPDTKIILISPNSVDNEVVSSVAGRADCSYYSYNVSYSALDSHPNTEEHREIADGLVKAINRLIKKS